jgi:hypothetical protein
MLCKGCGSTECYRIWTWDGGHYCDRCGTGGLPKWEGRDYTEKAILEGVPAGKTRDRMIDRHRDDVRQDRLKNPGYFKKLDAERRDRTKIIIGK